MMHRPLLLLALAPLAFAQTKPTLMPADYGKWESLGAGTLSPDGKWVAYDIRRTSGDGELRIAPVAGGKTEVVAFCSAAAFSADSSTSAPRRIGARSAADFQGMMIGGI